MYNPAMVLPERHLGLTVASELSDAMERLDAAADALAATPIGQMTLDDMQRWAVDFAAVEVGPEGWVAERSAPWTCLSQRLRLFNPSKPALAGSEPRISAPPALRAPPLPAQNTLPPNLPALFGKQIAVAQDAAFCFIYAANLDTLRALGAELVFFSPLVDATVPACDAVWLPGGYPELHADKLAANASLRQSLAAHIAAGKPVWAECGGMMALFDTLISAEGEAQPLWGLLPGTVRMNKRLAALGPQQLSLASGTVRGHTFHSSTTETPLQAIARTARPDTDPLPDAGEALWQQGSVRASYFHAWFPSCPQAVVELFTPPVAQMAL
jgi:cobyrinic acid a,c-diamide synthase